MHPPKFDYYRAESVNQAVSLAAEHPNASWLAGGHSLIPLMNLRLTDPGTLIDIGRIEELKGVHPTRDGGCEIGALTTHAMVAASPDVPTAVAEAASIIGDPQVRNRGTVGGNVAHADPASDLPTVLTAVGASFTIAGRNGQREVPASDFFKGLFETDLKQGELLSSIRIRSPHPGRPYNASAGSAYEKLPNPASRYAIVGAAAVLSVENGKCTHAGVAVGGLTPKATRAGSVEAALIGKELTAENIAAAAEAVQADIGDEVLGDMHASAEYRRAMATVYVNRALMKAAERAS